MRFGSMLWMENDADRGELRWFPKKKANGTPPLARCDAPIWRSCRDALEFLSLVTWSRSKG